jgi:hypothetical protein
VTQSQLLPHALSAAPHAALLPPAWQLDGQHTLLPRGAGPKHAPLFVPQLRPAAQSESVVHPPPVGHAGQLPPQSTLVSLPSRTPLVQLTQPTQPPLPSQVAAVQITPSAQSVPAGRFV